MILASDELSALATVAVPALVLVGEHDLPDFHASAQALTATLPDVRPITVAGAAHLAPLEQPEAFAELLLDFLREREIRTTS